LIDVDRIDVSANLCGVTGVALLGQTGRGHNDDQKLIVMVTVSL
jgi:hypothetical protein